jgi:hypothetical protein
MEITVKVNYKNEKLQKLRQAAGGSRRGKRPNVSEIRTGRPGYKQGATLHAAADL